MMIKAETKSSPTQYGLLYRVSDALISLLSYLNLVEFFKFVGRWLSATDSEERKIQISNIAIDVFIIAKWALIASLWYAEASSLASKIVVIYLIITNVFTYFYYHVWIDQSFPETITTIERQRRRFISLLQAILFSNFSFALLFAYGAHHHFSWTPAITSSLAPVYYSFSNSITGSSNIAYPATNIGYLLSTSQLLISFIFIAVIMSKTIPEVEKGSKADV